MRKLFSYALLLCASALLVTSCSKDPEDEKEKGDSVAEMTSFGFYAADNDQLTEDYIAETIASEMIIRLPKDVDRTALVARFEVTSDDVVTVGAATQESGVTSNNYNYPVDFVVTDALSKGVSASYTVVVGNILEQYWEKLPDINNDVFVGTGEAPDSVVKLNTSGYAMAVNPVDGLPYFVVSTKSAETGGPSWGTTRINVVKWTGSAYELVGDGRFSNEASSSVAITFDKDGVPYVAYKDASDDLTDGLTVEAYKGGAWEIVGAPSFSYKMSGTIGLAIDPKTNYPVTMALCYDRDQSLYRAPEVCYFDGAAWVTGIALPGRPAVEGTAYAGYMSCSAAGSDGVYLAVANVGGAFGNSLYKFENKAVTTLVEGGFVAEGISTTSGQDLSIRVTSDGKSIYMLSADDTEGGVWHPRLFSYDIAANEQAMVGNALPKVFSRPGYTFTLDSNDNPFVFYSDETADTSSKMLTAVSMNPDSKQWEAQIIGDREIYSNIFSAFNKENIGYVMCRTNDAPKDTSEVFQVYTYMFEKDILPE